MLRVVPSLLLMIALGACSSDTVGTDDAAWNDANVREAIPPDLHDVLRAPDTVLFCRVMNPQDSREAADEIKKLPGIGYLGILDSKEVTREEGRQLIDVFVGAIRAGQSERFAKCFEPHHVVRVSKAGKTVDLVVCFKCYNFEVWPGGKREVAFEATSKEFRELEEAWRGIVRKYGLKDVSKPQ